LFFPINFVIAGNHDKLLDMVLQAILGDNWHFLGRLWFLFLDKAWNHQNLGCSERMATLQVVEPALPIFMRGRAAKISYENREVEKEVMVFGSRQLFREANRVAAEHTARSQT
jgi:hypothetical protein